MPPCRIHSTWSPTGDGGIGNGIVLEHNLDGVIADYMIRAEGRPSPFKYIVVDRARASK